MDISHNITTNPIEYSDNVKHYITYDENINLTALDSSENILESDFIKQHWDISWNFNNFNNFPPLVRKKNFKVFNNQGYFIINNNQEPIYITLPNPSDWPHEWGNRKITIKNIGKYPVLSDQNNIKQLDTTITNSILQDNRYVTLVKNRDCWNILEYK